ncbi:MAG: hypothetical protein KF768_00800 [Phycisphaeraceae bacterium]|nr:hypothetical protein [Phycisphaeraceae bacterium]
MDPPPTDLHSSVQSRRAARRRALRLALVALVLLVLFSAALAAVNLRIFKPWTLEIIVTGGLLGLGLIVIALILSSPPPTRVHRRVHPDELAAARPPDWFHCQYCGYAIGDLPPHEPSGEATIRCPECGLVNRLPMVGPPICGSCGDTLAKQTVERGAILRCARCNIAWRINS